MDMTPRSGVAALHGHTAGEPLTDPSAPAGGDERPSIGPFGFRISSCDLLEHDLLQLGLGQQPLVAFSRSTGLWFGERSSAYCSRRRGDRGGCLLYPTTNRRFGRVAPGCWCVFADRWCWGLPVFPTAGGGAGRWLHLDALVHQGRCRLVWIEYDKPHGQETKMSLIDAVTGAEASRRSLWAR